MIWERAYLSFFHKMSIPCGYKKISSFPDDLKSSKKKNQNTFTDKIVMSNHRNQCWNGFGVKVFFDFAKLLKSQSGAFGISRRGE